MIYGLGQIGKCYIKTRLRVRSALFFLKPKTMEDTNTMKNKSDTHISFLFGFAIATIIWTAMWSFVVGKITDTTEHGIEYHTQYYKCTKINKLK